MTLKHILETNIYIRMKCRIIEENKISQSKSVFSPLFASQLPCKPHGCAVCICLHLPSCQSYPTISNLFLHHAKSCYIHPFHGGSPSLAARAPWVCQCCSWQVGDIPANGLTDGHDKYDFGFDSCLNNFSKDSAIHMDVT